MKKYIAVYMVCMLAFLSGCNNKTGEVQSRNIAVANENKSSIELHQEAVLLQELSAEKSLELLVNNKANVNACPVPKNAVYEGMISYETSSQAVATVDVNGQVTAVSIGEAIITSKVAGVSVQTKVIVLSLPTEIEATESPKELQANETQVGSGNNVSTSVSENTDTATIPSQPPPPIVSPPTPPRRHHQNGSDCTTWLFSHVSQDPTCRVPGTEVYYCKDVEICGLAEIRIGSIPVVPCDFSLVDYVTQKPVCRWCGQFNDENWKVPEELPGDYPNGLL